MTQKRAFFDCIVLTTDVAAEKEKKNLIKFHPVEEVQEFFVLFSFSLKKT